MCFALALTGVSPPAVAQGLQPQAPIAGGLFGTRRAQAQAIPGRELTITFDAFGGYDDNYLFQAGPVDPDGPVPQSGYISRAATRLVYRAGREDRFFRGTGTAFVNRQPLGPSATYSMLGGEGTLEGSIPLSRRNGLRTVIGAAYEPTFLFNVSGPSMTDTEPAGATPPGPIVGITDQRWLLVHGAAGFSRRWTPRQQFEVTYNASKREPVSGPGWMSFSQAASARHNWAVRPNVGLDFTYVLQERRNDQGLIVLPLRSHALQAQIELRRRTSAARGLVVQLAGGATASTFEVDGESRSLGITPVASGSIRVDLGPGWVASAIVRRDVSVLEGLSPEPFASNVVSGQLEGLAGRRVRLGLVASHTRGSSLVTDTGSVETTGVTVDVQLALTRYCALFSSYRFYNHRLAFVGLTQPEFPDRYRRNSALLGLSVWLPVFTRY